MYGFWCFVSFKLLRTCCDTIGDSEEVVVVVESLSHSIGEVKTFSLLSYTEEFFSSRVSIPVISALVLGFGESRTPCTAASPRLHISLLVKAVIIP